MTVDLVFPPFQMTTDEAGLIAVAILGVWVVGWAIRMVIKTMHAADVRGEND